ncbi:hypothetical protein NLJ89_g10715 [Agrocybe chaxingu]|uniref:Uncharacterized protein n=1 Tax=Agrocybe chaxingu TaxID=84603 RepID=A0A9W8JTR2_9AGAR|nr:hypothetical protein NLJ89_g10715 [Agrocybe chaxingu]
MCTWGPDRTISEDEKAPNELIPSPPTGPSAKTDVPGYYGLGTPDRDADGRLALDGTVGCTARMATVNARDSVELNSEFRVPVEGDNIILRAGMEGRPTDSEKKLSTLGVLGPTQDSPVPQTGVHISSQPATKKNNFIPHSQPSTHRTTPSEDLWRPAPAVEVKISKPFSEAQRRDRVKWEVVGAGKHGIRPGDKVSGKENSTVADTISGIQCGVDKVHRLAFLPLLRRLNSERQSQASKSSSKKENVLHARKSQSINKSVTRQPAPIVDLSRPKSEANPKRLPTDIWRPAPPAPPVRIAASPSMPYQQPQTDLGQEARPFEGLASQYLEEGRLST